MRTASPNQDGVEGTECEEAWIFTDTSAILLIIYLLVGNTFVLPHQGGIFFYWFATCSISLRNSWELEASCSFTTFSFTMVVSSDLRLTRSLRVSETVIY